MKHPVYLRLKSFILICTFFVVSTALCWSDPYPDFESITAKVRSSVVNIHSIQKITAKPMPDSFGDNELFKKYFKDFKSGQKTKDVTGSGFFVSSDGYIVTEYSVVENASRVEVTLDTGGKYIARIIGKDKASSVALLKIEDNNFRAVTYGDSSELKAGQWVMAIGSPFGMKNIITIGVVSSVDTSEYNYKRTGYIVNNVTINPGNGGGPLFNGEGEVVGMNAVIYSRTGSFNGLSFSVPINDVLRVVEKIRK